MDSTFVLNGKTYISARRGAEIVGYSGDYVGQLCRAGKVDAQMIGKAWFVSEESLVRHKIEQERLTEEMRERMSQSRKVSKPSDVPITVCVSSAIVSPFATVVPTSRPSALYVGKLVWMVVGCFLFLLIGTGSEIKNNRLVVSVTKNLFAVYTHTTEKLALIASATQPLPVVPLHGLQNFPEFFPTSDFDVRTGVLSVGQVSNVVASSGMQTDPLVSVLVRADGSTRTQNTVTEDAPFTFDVDRVTREVQRVFAEVETTFEKYTEQTYHGVQHVTQQYQELVYSTSTQFVRVGVAFGLTVDRASMMLHNTGITYAQLSDDLSGSLVETGTRLAQLSDHLSGQLQNVGIQIAHISDMLSHSLQNNGVALARTIDVDRQNIYQASVAYSDFVLLRSVDLQKVGMLFGQVSLRASNEFITTGKCLAYVSDYLSKGAQDMGRDLVTDVVFVSRTLSRVVLRVSDVLAFTIAQGTSDFLAQASGGSFSLVSGTSRVAQVIAEQFKSLATRTYTSAQVFLVSRSPTTLFSRWSTRTSVPVSTPVSSDDLVSLPKNTAVGIVVSPKDVHQSTESIINQIRNSFSDEVEVRPDQSGSAGIIKPIFKKVNDSEYVYVLVPLKK